MLDDNSTRGELAPFIKQQRLELELLLNSVLDVLSCKRLLIIAMATILGGLCLQKRFILVGIRLHMQLGPAKCCLLLQCSYEINSKMDNKYILYILVIFPI